MNEYTFIKNFLNSEPNKSDLLSDSKGFIKKNKHALKVCQAKLFKSIAHQSKANRIKNTLINSALTTESIKVCHDVSHLLEVTVDSLVAISKQNGSAYHHKLSRESLYLSRLASINNKLYYRINNCLITSDYTGAHEALYDVVEMEIKRAIELAKHGSANKIYLHNIYKGLIVVTQWYFKNK